MQYADNFASMLASASLKWLFISVCNALGCRSSKGEQFRKHSRYETFSPSLSCDMIIASNKKKFFMMMRCFFPSCLTMNGIWDLEC